MIIIVSESDITITTQRIGNGLTLILSVCRVKSILRLKT